MKTKLLVVFSVITIIFLSACSTQPESSVVDDSVPTTLAKPEIGEPLLEVSSLLPDYSLDDLINDAELIVKGRVTEILPTVKGIRVASGFEFLFTDVILTIDEHYFGDNTKKQVLIRVWGGKFDNTNEIWDNEPIFRLNESTVVFLSEFSEVKAQDSEEASPYYRVVASLLGKFEVQENKLIQEKTGKTYNLGTVQNKINSNK